MKLMSRILKKITTNYAVLFNVTTISMTNQ